MHPVTSPGTSNKRRRPVEPRTSRRFPVKDMKKREIIPLSTSPPVSRKTKHARKGLRVMAFIATFFIILSTVSVWRKRVSIRQQPQSFAPSALISNNDDQPNTQRDNNDHQFKADSANEASFSTTQSSQVQGDRSNSEHDGQMEQEPPQREPKRQEFEHQESEKQNSPHHESEMQNSPHQESEMQNSPHQESEMQNLPHQESEKQNPPHQEPVSNENVPNHDSSLSQDTSASSTEIHESHPHSEHVEMTKSDEQPVQHKPPIAIENVPEQIEWYTRADFKEGSRPICRITHPYILSNGTILLPDWMERHQRLLQRCGLGDHGFYSPEVPPTSILQESNNIDVDFALTIHLERFQEPTHDPSIYLTEHVLKSSYLFDIFSGNAREVDGVKEKYCLTRLNESDCESLRPPSIGLKPGLFVPHRIEIGQKDSWVYQTVELFGAAYGHGEGVVHLNTSAIILPSHAGQSDNLIGTRFRSIMTMDGMFRHLPVGGLKQSLLYSERTGVGKNLNQFSSNGKCSLSIWIASSDQPDGIKGASELQDKLKVMTKFALPHAHIDINLQEPSQTKPLPELIRHMQDVDIFLGGSGPDLNNIGFMPPSSTVFELMPFAIKPVTHESMAHALGLSYESVRGKPQNEFFKRCIDGEIFQLRKQNKLSFSENPEWQEPLMKAWDAAVAEFVLSGKSNFDVLTAESPVRNYHARVCALKQAIEIELDETARQVILNAKAKCGSQ